MLCSCFAFQSVLDLVIFLTQARVLGWQMCAMLTMHVMFSKRDMKPFQFVYSKALGYRFLHLRITLGWWLWRKECLTRGNALSHISHSKCKLLQEILRLTPYSKVKKNRNSKNYFSETKRTKPWLTNIHLWRTGIIGSSHQTQSMSRLCKHVRTLKQVVMECTW